jgi:hypothetical protein
MDRFSRVNFYKSDKINGVKEADLLTNTVTDFEFDTLYNSYTVTETDIQRPDLISQKIYGNITYWWILMKINNVHDVWNDLYIGQVLKYPTVDEMDRFYNFNSQRK